MTSGSRGPIALILCLAASGCTDAVPTSEDGGLIPSETETFEVEIPFSSFADGLQTFSGFGENADLGQRYIAHEWQGDLDMRTLIRFGPFPASVNVRPIDSGVSVPDSNYVPVSGELVVTFDTTETLGPPTIQLHADALLSRWDPASTGWDFAVDTIGDMEPWPEAGGGPVRPVAELGWRPTSSDTARFQIDSASVTEWSDAERDDVGLRLRSSTAGTRLRISGATLEVTVRPSVNPDTIVIVQPTIAVSSFIYTPRPEAPEGAFQIGGVPAHRATFELDLPESVDPGSAICAQVECPVELRGERILYAGIGFYSHPGISPGLTPRDTLPIELRPVLSPQRLPRSPLGCSVRGCGAPVTTLAPELFDDEAGTAVELSITSFVRNVLARPESDGAQSSTLALLAGPREPASLEPAVFYGLGGETEPYLRLLLTISEGLPLP